MSATASVFFDPQYLREFLIIEGAGTESTSSRVKVDIEDDAFLDTLVEVLAKEQHARRLRVAKSKVQRLESRRKAAIAERERTTEAWRVADEHERTAHHELHVAQQALRALEGDAE